MQEAHMYVERVMETWDEDDDSFIYLGNRLQVLIDNTVVWHSKWVTGNDMTEAEEECLSWLKHVAGGIENMRKQVTNDPMYDDTAYGFKISVVERA